MSITADSGLESSKQKDYFKNMCNEYLCAFNEENNELVKIISNNVIENIILSGNTFEFNKLLQRIPSGLLINIHADKLDIDESEFTAFLNKFFDSYEVSIFSEYQNFNVIGVFYHTLPRNMVNKLIVSLLVDEALILLEKENMDIIHLFTKVKHILGEISKELNNEDISDCINQCYLEIEDLLGEFLNIDYEFYCTLKIEGFSKLLKLKAYKSQLIKLYNYLFMLNNDEVINKATIEEGIRNLNFKYGRLASLYIKTEFSKDVLTNKFDRILYAFINDSIDFTNLYTFIKVHYGYSSLCNFLIWFGQNFREYSFKISNSFIEETERYFLSLDIYEIKQMNTERINYTGNVSIDSVFQKIKNRRSSISVIGNKAASTFINMNEYVYIFGSLTFKVIIGVSVAIFIIYICFFSGLVAAL